MDEKALILNTIINRVAEGLIVISSDYRIVYTSPLILQLLGLQEEEIRNKFCYQMLQQREEPCKEKRDCCPLRKVIKTGKPFKSFQNYLSTDKEGSRFIIDYYPLRDERGKVIRVIGVLKSLDELNKIKSELGKIFRFAAMGELLNGIAHNLNTPLSAVMARAEMMKERLKKLKEGDREGGKDKKSSFESIFDKNLRDADIIVSSAMKISGIIRNMMQKRLQESEETPQMLNLSYLLKEELQFLESDLKFKHEIKKNYFLDESIPYINGIYFHFSQSFTNLIKNAMESIDQSEVKELTISSKHNENNIYIEIHHTGLEGKKLNKGHQLLSSREIRLNQTYELLKPYNAELKIRNKPHDNLYSIRIPYKKNKDIID